MINMTKHFLATLIGGIAVLSSVTFVHAEENNAGDVTYVNGGIGQEESSEMRANAGDFNLRLYMSEGKHGHSITGVRVTITDIKGDIILDTPSGGPMLFVHVINGSYTINAIYSNRLNTRKAVVSNHRGVNVYLNWKATDTSVDNDADDE
jgi:hypothetical protein